MIVNLSTDQIRTVDQMRSFVEGIELAEIAHLDRAGAYALISRTLERVLYPRLGKADKGVVKRFLEKATGLSRSQPKFNEAFSKLWYFSGLQTQKSACGTTFRVSFG